MEKDIYKLELFEVSYIRSSKEANDGVAVRRVPGGWTFTEWENTGSENPMTVISATFVPYNEEFLKKVPPPASGWQK